MCAFTPTYRLPAFHATPYPVAPLSSLDPSVKMVRPSLSFSASSIALSRSSTILTASSFSGLLVISVPSTLPEYPIDASSLLPMADWAPTIPLASLPAGRLRSRAVNRLCLLSSWTVAGLILDSIASAPKFVVRKHPVTARTSWLTTSTVLPLRCSSPAFLFPSTRARYRTSLPIARTRS